MTMRLLLFMVLLGVISALVLSAGVGGLDSGKRGDLSRHAQGTQRDGETRLLRPPPSQEAGKAVYAGQELLLDYDPTPALVRKQTPAPRSRHPNIDIHCHWTLRQDPEALIAAMDERNIAYAVNLSGGHGAELERMLVRFDPQKYPRLITFANIDFSHIHNPGFAEEVQRSLAEAKRRGVRGVKIFKELGLTLTDAAGDLIPIDDPRLDVVWRTAGELGLPVLIHVADPVAFFQPVDGDNERWMQLKRNPDWSFHGPEFPSREEVLAQFDRVVERHPGTIFIAAHLGNYAEDLAKLGERLEKYPNLYADISAREAEWGRQPYTARRFFIRYADRLLFGTDRYPGRPDQPRYEIYFRMLETHDEYFDYYDHPFPPTGEWKVYGLYLPDEVLKKIYHDNAAKLLSVQVPAP